MKETLCHSERVSDIAYQIALELKLNEKDLEIIKIAGLLHDIGKVGIPSQLIREKEKLTDEEYALIKRHPEIGAKLLEDGYVLAEIRAIIIKHHERLDGTGYPKGLKDNEIDFLSKIIMVADIYDAMVSDRVYKKAKSKEEAIKELESLKGVKVDSSVVEALINIIKRGKYE